MKTTMTVQYQTREDYRVHYATHVTLVENNYFENGDTRLTIEFPDLPKKHMRVESELINSVFIGLKTYE